MNSENLVPLSHFAVRRRGSVDPKKFPDEVFELFSIPAYDTGAPELLKGSDIGSTKKIVEPGDVLISRIVPHIQRVWIVPEPDGNRQIASGEWIIFRGEEIVPPYLRQILLSRPFHHKFMSTIAGVGGSLLRARPSEVERIEIPVPDTKEEQHRVAAILDKADRIRRMREMELAISEQLPLSLFIDFFGDPVSNPLNFRQKRLADCAQFISGGTPSKKKQAYWSGSTPWVSPKDMKVALISNAEDYVSDLAFEETNLKKIPPRIPLIVVRGMILAHTVPIALTATEVAINQDIKAVKFDSDINPVFGFWCLKALSQRILNEVDTAAHGTKRIDMARLEAVPIHIPEDRLQSSFVEIIKKHEETRATILSALNESKQLSTSLGQRAFRSEL